MFTLLLVLHSILSLFLVGLVLIQQGKGADLGATLSGGSNTLFGAAGAADFITKLTTSTAIAFMVTSILLVRNYNSTGLSLVTEPSQLTEGSLFSEADEPAGSEMVKQSAPAQGVASSKEGDTSKPVERTGVVTEGGVQKKVVAATEKEKDVSAEVEEASTSVPGGTTESGEEELVTEQAATGVEADDNVKDQSEAAKP